MINNINKKIMFNILFLNSIFFLNGCGNNINIIEYQNNIKQVIDIPEVCKNEYNLLKEVPKVAVIKFSNNSNFGKAINNKKNVNFQNKKYNKNTLKRIIDPKLDKTITSALEGILSEMGGVDIYTREELYKIIKEQKLQQSGLFEEKTLVKIGKLSGVKYIITGSIDNVTQKYENYEDLAKTTNKIISSSKKNNLGTQIFQNIVSLAGKAASGMKISTNITFKIIDISTGKIVYSSQIKEKTNIGKIFNPSYEQIIGGIKENIMHSLKQFKIDLSSFFYPTGYIIQVRTNNNNNFIAQINLGSKQKIKPGQTFKVYKFSELKDPITKKISCDKSFIDVKLIVSKNQIQKNRSWTLVNGNDSKFIRPGQIIKRDKLSKKFFNIEF